MKKNLLDGSFLSHFLKRYLFLTVLFFTIGVWGQTNPIAQTLPYTQDFSSLTGSSTAYPAGWQGWKVADPTTTYSTAAGTSDKSLAGGNNTITSGANILDFNGKMGFLSTGSSGSAMVLALNTLGKTSISVSYKVGTQRQQTTDRKGGVDLQYRVGTTGAFTNLNVEYQNDLATNNTSGTGVLNVVTKAVTLPTAAENNAVVQLRWVYRDVSGSNNRPSFSIDDVSVSATVTTNINNGGVNIVGQFQNPTAYSQPTNCASGDYRVLQYRKVSTTISNPSDGRGQWATTVYAASSGGQAWAGNYPGGSSNGFLFTNGGGCGNTGTYDNKWNFSGVGQAAMNSVNIANYVSSGGNDMGINMSSAGYYTFVLKDNTASNNGYYIGYTSNTPVVISSTSQSSICSTSATITANLGAAPSPEEKFYLRYNTANDFGGSATTSQVLGTVSGSTVTFNVTGLNASSTYYYYILSTTHNTYTSLSEVDKSLVSLRFLDNNGSNYSITTAASAAAVTAAATNVSSSGATLNATSATVFGVCPATTEKGFVISSSNTAPNSADTKYIVTPVGTTGVAYSYNATGLIGGTTYYYRAYLYDGTTYTYGSVQSFTTLVPPINDTCGNAIPLAINASAVSGTFANSNYESPFTSGKDVWYTFTPGCSGKFTFTLSGYSGQANMSIHTACGTSNVVQSSTSGSTSNTLTTIPSSYTTGQTYYLRVVANNATAESSTFTIAVNNLMTINTQPTDKTVGSGSTASFTTSSPGNATAYQWQLSTDNGASWNNVTDGSGATTNSYTTVATTLAMNGNQYRVVISNGDCNTVTSNAAKLTVNRTTLSSDYFRSNVTTGNWADVTSWQASPDNTTWYAATAAPTSSATGINIKNGHTITVAANATSKNLTIDGGGILFIASANTFSLNGNNTINGTFTRNTSATFNNNSTSLTFGAGSEYNHSFNGGVIPTATWNPTSTCNITGMTGTAPTGLGQTFGNFTWNCLNQSANIQVNNNLFKTEGLFRLLSTNGYTFTMGGTTAGTYTNTLKSASIEGGIFAIAYTSGVTSTTTVTNDLSISGGEVRINGSAGNGTLTVGRDLLMSGSGYLNLLNASTSPSTTLSITRDLSMLGNSYINLESTNTSGTGVISIGRNFSSSSSGETTGNIIIDFGGSTTSGQVAGNSINIAGDFTCTGTGQIQTTSTNTPGGFVFNGSGVQKFTYTRGVELDWTPVTINSGSTLQLQNDFSVGSDTDLPHTSFNVLGSIDFQTFTIKATDSTLPSFNTASGAKLITSNSGGIGATGTTTGSLQGFGSVDSATSAAGRVLLVPGVNYVFNGATTTPFPTVGTFGNPQDITINSAVVSNLTSALTVTGNVNVSSGASFKLNPSASANSLSLGSSSSLNVANNATFDNGGENQITGSGSVNVSGTFITRDAQGFAGTNAAIPAIVPTLAAGSTVDYEGADQVVTVTPDYSNLRLAGTGSKSVSGSVNVNKDLAVISGSTLSLSTPTAPAVSSVTVSGAVSNSGTITINNDANFVQKTGSTYSGAGTFTVLREAKVPSTQFNYWSSPIYGNASVGQNMYTIYPNIPANRVMTYNTANDRFVTVQNPTYGAPGIGYSIKGPTNNTSSSGVVATFTGTTPNNGDVSVTLNKVGQNYNLVGNPYPSNIDLNAFYNDNTAVLANGTFWLWDNTNNTELTQLGTTYTGNSYATWNASSGTGVKGTSTTNSPAKTPTRYATVAQGFIVEANPSANVSLVFRNSERVNNAGVFFASKTNTENDAYWLELLTPAGVINTQAVVYSADAVNTLDKFDSGLGILGSDSFYSFADGDTSELIIQGRTGDLNISDAVPLGAVSFSAGNHRIRLSDKTGIFQNGQKIYLHDKLLNQYHDLTTGDYSFNMNKGTVNNRFEIVYKDAAVLGNSDLTKSDFRVYRHHDQYVVESSKKLGKVELYDAGGRLVKAYQTDAAKLEVDMMLIPNGVYIIKAENSGDLKTKKIRK